MSELLLAETHSGDPSKADPIWPATMAGAATWAHDLHDELERGRVRSGGELTSRVASWLRVQAVGRETVCVVEPRIATFSDEWNAAATAAGLTPVRLRRADGSVEVLAPNLATAATTEPFHPESVTVGWQHRVQLWLADRSEDLARATIRAIQR